MESDIKILNYIFLVESKFRIIKNNQQGSRDSTKRLN